MLSILLKLWCNLFNLVKLRSKLITTVQFTLVISIFTGFNNPGETKNIVCLLKICCNYKKHQRRLKFYSILFYFTLFSSYSTGSLKNNDTNTMNFNDFDHENMQRHTKFFKLFEHWYFWNASYKWVDFLGFTQIIQNGTIGEWKYD